MTATAKKAAPKTAAVKPAAAKATPAKAATPKADGPRTTCNFREGGWQGENFRALVSAPFACNEPRAKGKNHCATHEAMYVEAAKKRAALRKDSGEQPKAKAPRSAATSPKTSGGTTMDRELAAVKASREPARNSGGAKRESTPPAREMGTGPVGRLTAAVATAG